MCALGVHLNLAHLDSNFCLSHEWNFKLIIYSMEVELCWHDEVTSGAGTRRNVGQSHHWKALGISYLLMLIKSVRDKA